MPNRDPFDRHFLPRKRKSELEVISHEPLEPTQLNAVLKEAAQKGKDWRDLFIIGTNTGLRLKDACLLEWKTVGKSFIDTKLFKTMRSGGRARIPISKNLQSMLSERRIEGKGCYVLPRIAEQYIRNDYYILEKSRKIFEADLGKEVTKIAPGKHRKFAASIFSFHSFRGTFMSLLAQRDVSVRDAMRIMGWGRPEMVRIYEHELEKARGDAGSRALKMIESIDELQTELPEARETKGPLRPSKEQLLRLTEVYSSVSIGRIYEVSDVAVNKWLKSFGAEREKRVHSDLSDDEAVEKSAFERQKTRRIRYL